MKPRPSLVGLAFVSGLMLQITAQCEPSETATAASIAPAVIIRGSDSMIDMVNKLAQAFHESSFPMPTVTGGGSGVGIASLADATADICTMSRPMKPAERTRIENAGRVVTEIVVAYDARGSWGQRVVVGVRGGSWGSWGQGSNLDILQRENLRRRRKRLEKLIDLVRFRTEVQGLNESLAAQDFARAQTYAQKVDELLSSEVVAQSVEFLRIEAVEKSRKAKEG